MVIKIDDLSLAADLGFVGKDPRGAIAYKFPAREVYHQTAGYRRGGGPDGRPHPKARARTGRDRRASSSRTPPCTTSIISPRRISAWATGCWSSAPARSSRTSSVPSWMSAPVRRSPTFRPQTAPPAGSRSSTWRTRWPGTASMPPARPSSSATWSISSPAAPWTSTAWASRSSTKLIETGAVKDVADIYTLDRKQILEAVTKQGPQDRKGTARQDRR